MQVSHPKRECPTCFNLVPMRGNGSMKCPICKTYVPPRVVGVPEPPPLGKVDALIGLFVLLLFLSAILASCDAIYFGLVGD